MLPISTDIKNASCVIRGGVDCQSTPWKCLLCSLEPVGFVMYGVLSVE